MSARVATPLTDQITSTDEGMKVWQQERAILAVTERICELMDEQGVSRTDLASRLGKTKGFVSQLLNGSANMTIRTTSDLFWALGRRVSFRDEELSTEVATSGLRVIQFEQEQSPGSEDDQEFHLTFAHNG